jgi:hypothetical protein
MTHTTLLDQEEHIGTVDVWQLGLLGRWPIMRMLAPGFVEELELGRYMRNLLASHRWRMVRVVPRANARNVLDIYGIPVR